VRVAYLDTTHWLYNNHASLARSLEVQRARGVTPERHIVIHPNRAIEDADHALLMGGEHAYETYAFSGTPVHEIVNLGRVDLPDPSGKDFSEAARHFIWFGSRGLAHKGLGRTLEAFARMPEMRLTVCGPIADEPRFAEAYRRELFETPNIRLYGWIDVTGPDFAALARSALGVVFPSCAEARSGGVINCMQAGLSPLISVETNVDVEPDFGVLLEDSSVGAIVAAVRALSARSPETLAAMAHATWRTARERYGREGYKRALRTALERIVAEGRHPTSRGFFRIPRTDGAMAPLLDNP
jgi:glycosyltransferase involved in cell wall biosynthesis